MPRRRSFIVLLAVALGLGGALATKPGTARAYVVAGEIPQRPPIVSLGSKSPWQRGIWGTFCVSMPDEDGGVVGLCADAADDPEPRWLSVVRPGERILVLLRKTTWAKGAVYVYPRGCEDGPARRTFKIKRARTTWVVPRWFGSKRFELSLSFKFAMVDGRSGDADAALGILVSRTRDRGLVRSRNSLDCGEPY